LGNAETIAAIYGQNRVIAGVTFHGVTYLDQGAVYHAGSGETVIGAMSGERHRELLICSEILNHAGIMTAVSRDIKSDIWGKLIVNAAINPIAAVTGLKNGELIERDETMRVMRMVVKEGVDVTEKLGIGLPYDSPIDQIVSVCKITADNTSSMLQDVKAGRRTEVEFINGAITLTGTQVGIPTPVNETLTHIVKAQRPRSNNSVQGRKG
jgi:2-dehydropantoate 2-reductase